MSVHQGDKPASSSPMPPSALATERPRHDESWVEIASQPSSSSLSSAAEDLSTTNLRLHNTKRRRTQLHQASTALQEPRPESAQDVSSQEEYDESESESDRIMTSSGEGPQLTGTDGRKVMHSESDEDDENKTAVNYPINSGAIFTPQPNAFSHPPSAQSRSASQPVPGSYFPATTRQHSSGQRSDTQSHLPRNILSPSYSAAAHHDEALRNSLSTLLSCAAAARGLKNDPKTRTAAPPLQRARREPMTLNLVPESALPTASPIFDLQAPVFKPTLRRHSTTTTSTSPDRAGERAKRAGRASSKERRVAKKVRRSSSAEELAVSPTLLTWVLSAGVVVVLSALTFSAGYSLGKEAGRMEAGSAAGLRLGEGDAISDCAREAGRSSLGLRRSLARSAVQV